MDEETTLKDLLLTLVGMASYGKDTLVRKVMDELIFPWYEAKTGKYSSSKMMRKQVAEKVEQSLSGTLWITKGEAMQLGEDGTLEDMQTPSEFIVGSVFPQSRNGGSYELMISLYQKGAPNNAHTMDLQTFMRDFIPYEELSFQDFDS